jgi:hypothetical protein
VPQVLNYFLLKAYSRLSHLFNNSTFDPHHILNPLYPQKAYTALKILKEVFSIYPMEKECLCD